MIVRNWISQQNETAFLSETLAYQARVEADGGQVININFVDAVFRFCTINNILTSGLIGLSANAGVRFVGEKVDKIYNLFSTSDAIQTTDDNRANCYQTNYLNFRRAFYLDGNKAYTIPAIELPTYTDKFLTGIVSDSLMAVQHGDDINAADGYLWRTTNTYSWYVRRGTTTHLANLGVQWGKGKTVNRWMYNNTYNKFFKNRSEITSGAAGGTLRPNTSISATLHMFFRSGIFASKGLVADYFEFTQLTRTISDSFEALLYNLQPVNSSLSNVNLFIDGDSQFKPYVGTQAFTWADLISNYVKIYNNEAVPGQTSTQVMSNFQTHLDTYYNPAMDNICVILMGVNDFAISGTDITTTINNTWAAVDASNAKGFNTYVCTQRQWGSGQGKVINWGIANNWRNAILSDATAHNCTVIDLFNDSRWNTINACDDTTYYAVDKIHLTNLTSELWEQIIRRIIL